MNHVSVGCVVPADRKTSRRRIRCMEASERPFVLMGVDGRSQRAVWQDRKYSDVAAEIVGDECILAGRVNTHVGRPSTQRADRVQKA